MTDDEKTLRAIESQVLDRHYLQNALLQRNTNDAIVALLRCYGNVIRGLRNGSIPKNSGDARHETANEGFRGLAHCLRWIRSHCPHLIAVPSPGDERLQREALELLQWGVKYDPLYNQHTAYSRKVNGKRWVEAVVNESKKQITFLPREEIDPRFYISQVEAKKADDERQAALYPDQQFAELSNSWFQSRQATETGLRFDDQTIESSGVLELAVEWLRRSFLPEVSEDCHFGEFSARSLRRVLAALHAACLFRVRFEDASDSMPEQQQRVVTHVLSWKLDELIHWLQRITGVGQDELKALLPIFTFDQEPERVSVAHKPLILGASDRVFLLPRLFLQLPLSQMAVGALNIGEVNKSVYNSVCTPISNAVGKSIAEKIGVGCLRDAQVVYEKSFRLPDNSTITPDLVILSANGDELLVIDVKNANPPFGVSDIVEDIAEWDEKWQPRLSDYVAVFSNHPHILAQHLVGGSFQPSLVFGLILLRQPFPIPVMFPNSGAIDWPTLHHNLCSESDSRSISELCNWIQQRPDVAAVESLEWKQKEISVAEWTYRYSVLSAPHEK